jgi:putative transposase
MSYEKHKNSDIRTGRHCVFNMHVHLVFVTKYRKNVLENDHLKSLGSIFSDVCKKFESTLVECNGESDHVHLLINYPPKISISRLVNNLKTVSSRLLRKDYPNLNSKCVKNALWTPSYFAASCGGAPLDIIKQYVKNQQIINE